LTAADPYVEHRCSPSPSPSGPFWSYCYGDFSNVARTGSSAAHETPLSGGRATSLASPGCCRTCRRGTFRTAPGDGGSPLRVRRGHTVRPGRPGYTGPLGARRTLGAPSLGGQWRRRQAPIRPVGGPSPPSPRVRPSTHLPRHRHGGDGGLAHPRGGRCPRPTPVARSSRDVVPGDRRHRPLARARRLTAVRPRVPRPWRAVLAALAMWIVWTVAYLLGLSHTGCTNAYHHYLGVGLSRSADQQISTGCSGLPPPAPSFPSSSLT